jgi:stage V sporulation protein S
MAPLKAVIVTLIQTQYKCLYEIGACLLKVKSLSHTISLQHHPTLRDEKAGLQQSPMLCNFEDAKTKTLLTVWRLTMDMIKVSANSRTSAVAGAIAGIVREHKHAEVQAIGAGAVNQAVKALVLATGYLKLDGIFVTCVPEFADVTIEDKVRTAIKLVVDPH